MELPHAPNSVGTRLRGCDGKERDAAHQRASPQPSPNPKKQVSAHLPHPLLVKPAKAGIDIFAPLTVVIPTKAGIHGLNARAEKCVPASFQAR
jgi:hypothetical protein